MPHVTHASEALGLSPVALLITDMSAIVNYVGPAAAFETFITDRRRQPFRAAPQTELVTSACMLSSEFLCLDSLHAPTHLWFYSARSRPCFSSFSGITTSIPQEPAACAFITRDQRLSSSRRLSAHTRHRTHRTQATQHLIQLSRGSFAASV